MWDETAWLMKVSDLKEETITRHLEEEDDLIKLNDLYRYPMEPLDEDFKKVNIEYAKEHLADKRDEDDADIKKPL
ncbi:hypothetical protein L596_030379 [Steinernema carpocapsae]|uniref:Uncharacterized protein n=1 Tax=Steinernema carpocapsae TaxID=34508 RepID=A0A4U5LP97_STECR|nr:hypothetical protein L596_030379 [Steinernema carpocapsae]